MEHPSWQETFQGEISIGKESSGEQASSFLEPYCFPPFLSSMRMGLTKEFKSYKNSRKDRMKKKKTQMSNLGLEKKNAENQLQELLIATLKQGSSPQELGHVKSFPSTGLCHILLSSVDHMVEQNSLPGLEIRISGF